jgi:hypothetical protein
LKCILAKTGKIKRERRGRFENAPAFWPAGSNPPAVGRVKSFGFQTACFLVAQTR